MNNNYTPIKSFQDLNVYQNLYQAMLMVHKDICFQLPKDEKFDLIDQMKRASKGAPALIAEGFAKRYQPKAWHKYLQDTIGECGEMIHHLSVCLDLYGNAVNKDSCRAVIDLYIVCCKQLAKLDQSWIDFHDKNKK